MRAHSDGMQGTKLDPWSLKPVHGAESSGHTSRFTSLDVAVDAIEIYVMHIT